MRIAFDPAASDDLDRIFAWIAKDNPRAAFESIARIEAKVMRLETPENYEECDAAINREDS
jgi:plasmid stabilization system protein ParE